MMTHVNIAQARAFLQRLDPEASAFTFQTYSDRKRKPDPFARIVHGDPGNGIMDDLGELNAKGAGIFVTINATDGKGRQAHNVVAVRAVFVDLDGAPLGPVLQAGLEPHIVCESSRGRYHAYWLCDDCPLDQFERVQLALSRKFGGDPKVHDLSRVLRVPGYVHHKGEPFVSHLVDGVGFNGPPYALAEIIRALDLDLDAREQRHERAPSGDGTIGEGGRNDHLFRLGRSMAKRGLSREVVAAALAAENRARCTPPLDGEEIEALCDRAFSAKDAPSFGQAGEDRPFSWGTADDRKVHLPSVSIGGALTVATRMPDLEYVLHPVLVQGQLITMTAHPGHGKSTVSMAMSFAVALGHPLGAMRPTQPGGLVYFVSAEDVEGTRRRIFAEAAHRGLSETDRARIDRHLRWVHLDGLLSPDLIAAEIEADCDGHPIRSVFVDTGPALFQGDSENDNTQMQGFAFGCRRFTQLPGQPSAAVLWHPTKNAGADNLAPRGGSALLGAVDGNLTIWHDPERGIATLARSPWKWRGEHFEPLTFRLETVELILPSGKPTSIKVALPDAQAAPATAPKVIRRVVALDALHETISEYGARMPGSSTIPKGVRAVTLDQWRARWLLRTGYGAEGNAESARVNFAKDRAALLASGAIVISSPYVWTA